MHRNRTARAAKHRAAAAHERAAAERLRHRLEIEHGHDFPAWDRSILIRYEEIARDHEARAAALEKPSRTAAPQRNPIRDATQAAAAALATLSRALRDRADALENIDDDAAEKLRRRSEAAAIDAAALRRSLPEIP